MSSNTKKPEVDYSYRSEEDRPKTRTCLNCRSSFRSEGWGNRLCTSCRNRG